MPEDTQNVKDDVVVVQKPVIQAATASVAVSATPAVNAPAMSEPVQVTLNHFGIGLSQKDKRVELVNAFLVMERRAGNYKDTEASYSAKFEEFLNAPA
jgi:hypothetical protein